MIQKQAVVKATACFCFVRRKRTRWLPGSDTHHHPHRYTSGGRERPQGGHQATRERNRSAPPPLYQRREDTPPGRPPGERQTPSPPTLHQRKGERHQGGHQATRGATDHHPRYTSGREDVPRGRPPGHQGSVTHHTPAATPAEGGRAPHGHTASRGALRPPPPPLYRRKKSHKKKGVFSWTKSSFAKPAAYPLN